MCLLRYFFTLFFITLFFITLSFPAFAAHLADDLNPSKHLNTIELPLTKASAAELIHTRSKGKVLSVDKKEVKGKTIFRIKVLHNNGKLKVYRLNPLTGHPPH